MSDVLIIFGSKSHVLKEFKPLKNYSEIIYANKSVKDLSLNNKYFQYDLSKDLDNKKIINFIKSKKFEKLDIVFASYYSRGLKHTDKSEEINNGLIANIARPLSLFATLSEEFNKKIINLVFISSIYSLVSPKSSNYDSTDQINPLFYGASKAAINQGIRWLSTRNKNHKFNSIILGAMPKDNVFKEQPKLIDNLLNSIPLNNFVSHKELNKTINFLLEGEIVSIRGANITLDGGYTLW